MKINNVVIATIQEQPEGFQGVSFNEAGLNNIIKNNDKEPVDIKDIETQEVVGNANILLKDKKLIADMDIENVKYATGYSPSISLSDCIGKDNIISKAKISCIYLTLNDSPYAGIVKLDEYVEIKSNKKESKKTK